MPAIKVENLGKKYHISHESQAGYSTLRDKLSHGAHRLAHRFRHPLQPYADNETEPFWALKDINFEIQQGDRVGIIGRNGAGKSTLLKILSRITAPTTGKITINGRVASLLEVGTGFHPELTGRENIFLNGAILGMRKQEIQRKFDEIVDFAEVEKFLDTPVKHYSSGMYVRLAFAVAAHLNPEILIVDEVLSVGDLQFQRKCLGKIEDISHSDGRTILFVSHNMQAVKQLCNTVICINKGNLDFIGAPYDGIINYYKFGHTSALNVKNFSDTACITNIKFLNENQQEQHRFKRTKKLTVLSSINIIKSYTKLNLSMAISHAESGPVFSESIADYYDLKKLDSGKYTVSFDIDLQYLKSEQYSLTMHLVDLDKGEVASQITNIPLPEIYCDDSDQILESRRWGIVRIPVKFTTFQKA